MIKAFISKTGGGRTMCAIAECASQKDKKVAFVSLEISQNEIIKRVSKFNPVCEKFTAFSISSGITALNFYKKIKSIVEEYDLICIDSPQLIKCFDMHVLNNICFDNFTNQCQEMWITMQASTKFGDLSVSEIGAMTIKKTEEQFECLQIKQICRRINHSLVSGNFIEAVDLETKEVKTYNLSNLFKN